MNPGAYKGISLESYASRMGTTCCCEAKEYPWRAMKCLLACSVLERAFQVDISGVLAISVFVYVMKCLKKIASRSW